MNDIVILGSGGFAKEVAFLLEGLNKHEKQYNIIGYVDNEPGTETGKYKIVGNDEWLLNLNREISVAIGIGNPTVIKKVISALSINKKIAFPNIIHPSVIADWDRIELGHGNIICAGNIFTTDIKIGSFNIFNLSCTLGHDSLIGSFNVVNPTANLSGGIEIGDRNLIGTGAQVLQYIRIGDEVILGAGAVASKDLVQPGVYIGIPAKRIK